MGIPNFHRNANRSLSELPVRTENETFSGLLLCILRCNFDGHPHVQMMVYANSAKLMFEDPFKYPFQEKLKEIPSKTKLDQKMSIWMREQ